MIFCCALCFATLITLSIQAGQGQHRDKQFAASFNAKLKDSAMKGSPIQSVIDPEETIFTVKLSKAAFTFALGALVKFMAPQAINAKLPKKKIEEIAGIKITLEDATIGSFTPPDIFCQSEPNAKGMHLVAKGGRFAVAGKWHAKTIGVDVSGDVVVSSETGVNAGAWLLPTFNDKMEKEVLATWCHSDTKFDVQATGGFGLGDATTSINNLVGEKIQQRFNKKFIKKTIPVLKDLRVQMDKYVFKCGLRSIEATEDDVILKIGASFTQNSNIPKYLRLVAKDS